MSPAESRRGTGPIRRQVAIHELLALPYQDIIYEALTEEDLIRLVLQAGHSSSACCALSELALRQAGTATELAWTILEQSKADSFLQQQAVAVVCERDLDKAVVFLADRSETADPGLLRAMIESIEFEQPETRPDLLNLAARLADRAGRLDQVDRHQSIDDFMLHFQTAGL